MAESSGVLVAPPLPAPTSESAGKGEGARDGEGTTSSAGDSTTESDSVLPAPPLLQAKGGGASPLGDLRSLLTAGVYSEQTRLVREALNVALAALVVVGAVQLLLGFGSVPRGDALFVLAFFSYTLLSNSKMLQNDAAAGKVRKQGPFSPLSTSPVVQLTTVSGLALNFFLPWLDILTHRRDDALIDIISPHLFCFSSQVLLEYALYTETASTLLRVLVPAVLHLYRLAQAWTWCTSVLPRGDAPLQLGLAALNLAHTGFALFFVLLPQVLPLYVRPRANSRPAPTQ